MHRVPLAVALSAGLLLVALSGYEAGVTMGKVSDRPLPAGGTAYGLAPPSPVENVAATALSRVLTVEAVRSTSAVSFGTAWLLDGSGDLVTNAHVIAEAQAIRLRDRLDHAYVGTVVGVDEQQDVAVVRTSGRFTAPPLPTNRHLPRITDPVAIIASGTATGHPDVTIDSVVAAHVDIVARGNPDVDPGSASTAPQVTYRDMLLLQGHPVFPGNSGGPVLDRAGDVIGIVTLASRTASNAYAIPIGRVIDELRGFGRRGVASGPA